MSVASIEEHEVKTRVAQILNRWPTGGLAFRPATLRHLLTHTSGIGELQGLRDLLRGVEQACLPRPAVHRHPG